MNAYAARGTEHAKSVNCPLLVKLFDTTTIDQGHKELDKWKREEEKKQKEREGHNQRVLK